MIKYTATLRGLKISPQMAKSQVFHDSQAFSMHDVG